MLLFTALCLVSAAEILIRDDFAVVITTSLGRTVKQTQYTQLITYRNRYGTIKSPKKLKNVQKYHKLCQ